MAVVTPLNNFLGPEGDTVTVDEQLLNTEYWHRGSGCLGAAAPVTGAAADEYNLNVVDCNASVTVARRSSISVSEWGSGGYPQPPEANVKWFSVASPGPAGNFKFCFFPKF